MKGKSVRPMRKTPADRSKIELFLEKRDREAETELESRHAANAFHRSKDDAEKTADLIMKSVLDGATPTLADRNPFGKPIPRLVTILAAAALLVIVSSVITQAAIKSQNQVEITFILVAPDAKSVSLVGDFNAWSLKNAPLKPIGNSGRWSITISLTKGRAYNYNFVLDGTQWIVDPKAAFRLDDGLGGTVSSLVL